MARVTPVDDAPWPPPSTYVMGLRSEELGRRRDVSLRDGPRIGARGPTRARCFEARDSAPQGTNEKLLNWLVGEDGAGRLGSIEKGLIVLIFYALASCVLFTSAHTCLHPGGACAHELNRRDALQGEAAWLRAEIQRLTDVHKSSSAEDPLSAVASPPSRDGSPGLVNVEREDPPTQARTLQSSDIQLEGDAAAPRQDATDGAILKSEAAEPAQPKPDTISSSGQSADADVSESGPARARRLLPPSVESQSPSQRNPRLRAGVSALRQDQGRV